MNINKNLNEIIDNLVNYSGSLFEIIYDNNLYIPGLSLIEKDFRGNNRYKIIINYNLIKNEPISVIAHILSHEWGHHILKHTYTNPINLTENEKINIELEADTYANNFIKTYNYNKNDILDFLKKNLEKELNLYENKLNFFKKRIDILYK